MDQQNDQKGHYAEKTEYAGDQHHEKTQQPDDVGHRLRRDNEVADGRKGYDNDHSRRD
ncbi:hypothetical protein D3C81_2339670 [compost metagenome]